MFNINNIKIGDYVETRDGEVGYITNTKECLFLFRYKTKDGELNEYCGNILNLNKYFKQIGTYVFEDNKPSVKDVIKAFSISKILNIPLPTSETEEEYKKYIEDNKEKALLVDEYWKTKQKCSNKIEFLEYTIHSIANDGKVFAEHINLPRDTEIIDKINEIIKKINERG